MIEPAHTIINKALLNIVPSSDLHGSEFLECVYSILADYINSVSGLRLSPDKMSRDLWIETPDHQHKLQMVCVPPLNDAYPLYWAVRLKSQDAFVRYRTITLHIGIKQTSETRIALHIASTSTDNLGGRFILLRPPQKQASPLIESLLTHPDIYCVTGNYVLLSESIKLTNRSMEYLVDLLFESSRDLPVVLITCPDILNPDSVHSLLQGNAVVCYAEYPGMVMLLNDHLPEPMRVSFGSVRIFLPLNAQLRGDVFHPVIPLSDIYRLNSNEIYSMLYRAYAEYFRSAEWRSFITVDSCLELRTVQNTAKLKNSLAHASAEMENTKNELTKEKEISAALTQKLTEMQNSSSNSEIAECEALLEEYMKELDNLKEGAKYLISKLYGRENPISIPETAHPLVSELIQSANFRHADALRRRGDL